jgi:hypothetical protein
MKTKYLIPLASLALFCACKGKGNAQFDVTGSTADSAKTDSVGGTAPKLVKTASINFKVKNVQQTAKNITALTERFGGLIIHKEVSSSPGRSKDVKVGTDSVIRIISFSTMADITVKVPSVKLEKYMDSLATMSLYVTSRSINVTDKSLDYLSAQLKLKSRTDLINQQKKGKVIIKDPTNVLNLQDDMIDQQIGNKQIDDAVKNSIVNLNFYQSNTISKETIANDDPDAYGPPIAKRAQMAIEHGGELFADLFIALLNIWFLIPVGFFVWVIIKYNKKKRQVILAKN